MDTPIWQYFSGFTIYTGIVVLALMCVTQLIQKKGGKFSSIPFLNRVKTHNPYALKVESSISVDPRKNVYVIRSGEQRLLVGSSNEGLTFMTTLDSVPESETQCVIEPEQSELEESSQQMSGVILPPAGLDSLSFARILRGVSHRVSHVPVLNQWKPLEHLVNRFPQNRLEQKQPVSQNAPSMGNSRDVAQPSVHSRPSFDNLNNVERQLADVILAHSASEEE